MLELLADPQAWIAFATLTLFGVLGASEGDQQDRVQRCGVVHGPIVSPRPRTAVGVPP